MIMINGEGSRMYDFLPEQFKQAVDASFSTLRDQLIDLGASCDEDSAKEMIDVVTDLVLSCNPRVERYVTAAKYLDDAKREMELALTEMAAFKEESEEIPF